MNSLTRQSTMANEDSDTLERCDSLKRQKSVESDDDDDAASGGSPLGRQMSCLGGAAKANGLTVLIEEDEVGLTESLSRETRCLLFRPMNLDLRIQTEKLTLLYEVDGQIFYGCDLNHTAESNKSPWVNGSPRLQVIRWILTTVSEVIINVDGTDLVLKQAPFRIGPNFEQLYLAPYWPFLKKRFDVSQHRELFKNLFKDTLYNSFDFGMNLPSMISMLPMHIHGKMSGCETSDAYRQKKPQPSRNFEDHGVSAEELANKWFFQQVKEGEFRPRSFPFNDSNEVGNPEKGIEGNPGVVKWMSEAVGIHNYSMPVELPVGQKSFYCGHPMERLR